MSHRDTVLVYEALSLPYFTRSLTRLGWGSFSPQSWVGSPFTDKETEAQGEAAPCLRSHSPAAAARSRTCAEWLRVLTASGTSPRSPGTRQQSPAGTPGWPLNLSLSPHTTLRIRAFCLPSGRRQGGEVSRGGGVGGVKWGGT